MVPADKPEAAEFPVATGLGTGRAAAIRCPVGIDKGRTGRAGIIHDSIETIVDGYGSARIIKIGIVRYRKSWPGAAIESRTMSEGTA